MEKPKVIFENVYKEYSMFKSNKDKLVDFIIPSKEKKSFFAVKDVSFKVYPGETIGIIGINGSGKSTISNLLAEVIPATAGNIKIDGETSLIAISVGLNNQLSGLENIHLKCMMHGMSEAEIKAITSQVIEFADIGSFIEQPVKNYSSGMRSRLGFAISVHTNPDIMVVDEALSVGDETFYNKCMDKVNEFKQLGKTIFFVSHSVTQMRKISDRVMWIHYGEMKEFGEANKVLNNYKAFIKWFKELNPKEQKEYKQDMFETQTVKRQRGKVASVKRKVEKETRKSQRWFNIQFVILSLLFVIMMTLMVTGTSIRTGWYKVTTFLGSDMAQKETVERDSDSQESVAVPIDKKGFVIEENIDSYNDLGLENNPQTLDIFSEVHVIEELEGVYKIEVNEEVRYLTSSSVDIQQQMTDSGLIVEELLPYLLEEFQESYLYYLSFIGQDLNHVQEKLMYFEPIDSDDDWEGLQLAESELKYFANENKIVTKIEVPITNEISEDLSHYMEEYAVKNKEMTKYYIMGKSYIYLLDLDRKMLTIVMV